MGQRSSFKVLGVEGDPSMLHIQWFDLQQQGQNPVLKVRKTAGLSVLPGRKHIPTLQLVAQVRPGWTTLNCRDQRRVFMCLPLSCYHTELNTLWSCTEDFSYFLCFGQKMRISQPEMWQPNGFVNFSQCSTRWLAEVHLRRRTIMCI